MKHKKLVLAFSGGMDSSVLLFMAAERGYEEIHTVTFDYDQRHRREMQCVPLQKWDLEEKYPNVKFYTNNNFNKNQIIKNLIKIDPI
jgi:7-cyano-7-deazaguanine synthase